MASLFGDAKPAPVPHAARPAVKPVTPLVVPPAPAFLIEVFNGPKRTELKFVRRQEEQQ